MLVFYHLTCEGVGSPESEIFRQSQRGHFKMCALLRGLLFEVSRAKGTPRPDEVPKTGVFFKITVMARRFLTRKHYFDIAGASICSHHSLKIQNKPKDQWWILPLPTLFPRIHTACSKRAADDDDADDGADDMMLMMMMMMMMMMRRRSAPRPPLLFAF